MKFNQHGQVFCHAACKLIWPDDAVKQEGQLTFTGDSLFIVPARFILQHPPTEQQEVILIHRDDAFQFPNQAVSWVIRIHGELKTACLVYFQFKRWGIYLQTFQFAVVQKLSITINPVHHHRSPSCHVKVMLPVPVTVNVFMPCTSSSSGRV